MVYRIRTRVLSKAVGLSLVALLLTAYVAAGPNAGAPARAATYGEVAAQYARNNLVGKPYVFGARSTTGFDCSGSTYLAWNSALPGKVGTGGTKDQYGGAGEKIYVGRGTTLSNDSLLPGDLLFWSSDGSATSIYHVAIYLGSGQILQTAPGKDSWPGTINDNKTLRMDYALRPAGGTTAGDPAAATGVTTGITGPISGAYANGALQIFGRSSGTLTDVWRQNNTWSVGSTGLPLSGSVSMVNMGDQWPQGLVAENGWLYHVVANASGWYKNWTGISVSGVVSAVDMGGAYPQAMVNDGGALYQIWHDGTAWQKGWTGLYVAGTVSAVNMGGNWPEALVSEGGLLYHIHANGTGWHKDWASLYVTGNVSAVNMGGGWPQAMVVEGGVLHQIWADSSGWHKGSTGLTVYGYISAVNTGGQWPEVAVSEGGVLKSAWGTPAGWQIRTVG